MRAGTALLLVMVLAGCTAQPLPSPSVAASATATSASATSASATSTPPATRRPSISVKTTPVAAIPRDFVYVESSPGRDVTLWLVDLSGAAPPVAVARWTLGSGSFAASRDGKTVIVASPGDRSVIALHLVRPLTGEATVLFDGPADGRAFFPRLSPDGRSFAFTLQRETGSDGLWVGDVTTGTVRQLVPGPSVSPTAIPYEWSDDGAWLAYFKAEVTAEQGCCTFLENIADGRRVRMGKAHVLSWRAQEPRIVAAAQTGKGNQGAYGALLYTFDLAQQRRTELSSIDPGVTQVAWNPTKDEFLSVEETTGCPYRSTLWVRPIAGGARRVGTLATVQRAWWSSDGSALFALVRGTGTDALVIDAVSGRSVATIPNDVRADICP